MKYFVLTTWSFRLVKTPNGVLTGQGGYSKINVFIGYLPVLYTYCIISRTKNYTVKNLSYLVQNNSPQTTGCVKKKKFFTFSFFFCVFD